MALDLENLISNREEARRELQNIQQKVRSTSDELLEFCLTNRETRFLKLDDEALRRYSGYPRR